jgi:predicted membrane protein
MKRKIAGWVFFLAALAELIVNAPKVLEVVKMIDRKFLLEIALLIIFIVAGIIYLVEKYKEFKKWIGRLSYKDEKGSYSDLKGKIKFYIREELEKNTTLKK